MKDVVLGGIKSRVNVFVSEKTESKMALSLCADHESRNNKAFVGAVGKNTLLHQSCKSDFVSFPDLLQVT